jgi:hypothetical protein
MPLPEEQVWRQRACEPLERDGNSLEGALGSRPRRGLTREGVSSPRARRESHLRVVRPTSEADLYWGGAVPHEQSGVPPEGGWADRSTGHGPVGLFVRMFRLVLRLFFMSLSGFPLVV